MKNVYYSLLPALFGWFLFFSTDTSDRIPEPPQSQLSNAAKSYDLFKVNTEQAARSNAVTNAVYLSLNEKDLSELYHEQPYHLSIAIPTDEGNLSLTLRKHQILTDDFVARGITEEGEVDLPVIPGAFYTGHLSDDPTSVVTLSVFENWVMGILSFDGHNYNLGPMDELAKGAHSPYIFYREKDMINPPKHECHVEESNYKMHEVPGNTGQETASKQTSVVKIYIEADYRMFLDRGRNEQEVINYVTGLFNEVATLYANEQILTRISEIKVWMMQDPYPSNSSNAALNAFTSRLAGNFNGDLAHLISTIPAGNGGVAWLDVLCVRNRANAYSNIGNSYSPVPTYSWSVEVFTHEMGHNLGSKHTQACVWGPNRNQALDDCYPTEGGCSRGPTPTNGGTIMSYCHLAPPGINFQNGFGNEPGDVIRQKVASANCLDDIFDCLSKIQLEAGVTYAGNTANGGARGFETYSCLPGAHRGNEIAHAFTAPIPGWAYINYSENVPERLDLFLMTTCNPDSCVKAWQGGPSVLDSFFVEFGKEYVFVVDVLEDSPGGAYSITISFPGSGCATTVSLTEGVTFSGTTVDGSSNFVNYSCTGTAYRGREVGHFFISPVDGEATVTFNESTAQDMRLFMGSACNPDSCLQSWAGPNVVANVSISAGIPYYFIVDVLADHPGGNYTLTISMPESNTCICTNINAEEICENFESFNTGQVSPQSLCWTTGSGNSNVWEDGFVTDQEAASGDQALAINGSGQTSNFRNSVIRLGNRSEGKYILKYKINVGLNKSAYWRVYHTYVPGNPDNQIAFELTMDHIPGFGGSAKLYAGNPNGSSSAFFFINNGATWSDMVMDIDLDADLITLYYSGLLIHSWPFSNTRNGSNGIKELAAINFIAQNAETEYYIDDFHLYPNNGFYCDESYGVFCDDFDRYIPGTLTNQDTAKWILYEGGHGGPVDVTVNYNYSSSGLNSVFVQSPVPNLPFDNVVAKLGNITSGKYKMQFKMYVQLGGKASYRVLHDHKPNGDSTKAEIASEVYFYRDGNGVLLAGNALYTFPFPRDVWFDVVQLIDFGLDQTTLFVHGKPVATWPFSDKSTGPGGMLKLAGLNFYTPETPAPGDPPPANIYDYSYYFENVELFDLSKYLNVDPTTINVEPDAGSANFSISSNTPWTVEESTTWLTVGPRTGVNNGMVTINYDANPSPDSRVGKITVRSQGAAKKIVEVIQAGADPYIIVTPGDQTVSYLPGSITFDVASNVSWGAFSKDESWLTVRTPAGGNLDGSFTIDFKQNLGGIRSDTIVVTGPPAADVHIIITQEQGVPALLIDKDTIRVTSDAGTESFELLSNVNWQITDDGNWLTTQPSSGSGSDNIQINYDENLRVEERQAIISVTGLSGGVGVKQVVVIQEGALPFMTVDPLIFNIDWPAGSRTTTIDANVDWTAFEDADWFTISKISGYGDESLVIDFEENITINTRRDTITITGDHSVGTFRVILIQTGQTPALAASPLIVNLPNTPAGSFPVTLTTNVDWLVMEDIDWLDVSPMDGYHNATLTLTYEENLTLFDRSGTITVRGSNGVANVVIEVNQIGTPAFMEVDQDTFRVAKEMGAVQFNLSTNVDWTLDDDASWLEPDRFQGSGSALITLNYIENTAPAPRVAILTISGNNGVGDRRIVIIQEGLGVTLVGTPDTLRVSSALGSVNFSVTANVLWAARDDASWVALNPTSGFGNGMVRINYLANPSGSPRVAHMILSTAGFDYSQVVLIQEGAPPVFDVTPAILNIPASAGNTNFDIAGNVEWTVTADVPWLSFDPTTGTGAAVVTVIYEANPTTMIRTGTITITAVGSAGTRTIEVTQDAGQPAISVDRNTVNVDAPAGSTTVEVTANIDWTATISGTDTWLRVTPEDGSGNGTLTIDYDENTSTQSRQATISVRAVGLAIGRTITVIQAGAAAILTVDPLTLNVPSPAGMSNINITSNVEWTASDDATWLTLSAANGMGNANLIANYTENTDPSARTATITISGTGVATQMVTLTQAGAGAILSVTPMTITVPSPPGMEDIQITSNLNWTATDDASWLTLSATNGTGNATLTATFDENTDIISRIANISISANGVGTQVVTLIQEGLLAVLTTDRTNINVNAPAGNATLGVNSNIAWTASENTSWFTIDRNSGIGSGNIRIDYDENQTTQSRSGTITLEGNGVPDVVVTVTQMGTAAFLTVSQTNINVTPPMGTTAFQINSNVNWTVTENATWLSVTPANGSNDGAITINYAENTSTSGRSATITVSGVGVPDQTVTIVQSGVAAFLTVNPTTLNVSAPAGTTNFQINANLDWSITDDASWLTTSDQNGTGVRTITVNYDENTSTQNRSATITVTASGLPAQTITVTQAGVLAFLTVSTNTINISAPAGSVNFGITANVDWTITGVPSWFTLTKTDGTGNDNIGVNYQENLSTQSRTATLTISSSGLTPNQTIIVTQAGAQAFLTASPATINLTSPAGMVNFQINSNVAWNITGVPAWFTLSTSNDSGSRTVTVNYQANGGASPRSATLTITATGLPNQTIVITQAGTVAAFLNISPGNQSVTSSAGTVTFTITSNVNWTVTSDESWATVLPGAGSGNGFFVVSYSANPNTSTRVARFTIKGTGLPDQVIILTQSAFSPNLGVSPQHYDVGPNAGSVNFNLISNLAWTVNVDVPWVNVTPNFGSGNTTLTANYQANPNPVIRTATITVSAGGISPITVTITQSEGTSTNELEQKYALVLSPNPASDELKVDFQLEKTELIRFDLISVAGSVLTVIAEDNFQAGTQQIKLNVQPFANGIYFLRMQTPQGVAVKRFVVGH